MLATIAIKDESKVSLVNFISKAHLTAFKISTYLEIIGVEYFYIFMIIYISSMACNSYLLLLLLCAMFFLLSYKKYLYTEKTDMISQIAHFPHNFLFTFNCV